MITIQQTVQMPEKKRTNETEQVSVGRSEGKEYTVHTSRHRKLHAV